MKVTEIVCPYCGAKHGAMCTLHTDVIPNIECEECGGFFDIKIKHIFEVCESDRVKCDVCGASVRRVYSEREGGVTYCPQCYGRRETNG